MAENEKDENSLIESQENIERDQNSFDNNTDDKIESKESQSVDYQQKIDELNKSLNKEKDNALRWRAQFETLERNTPDKINELGDKIILEFLTVYEDFIRAKNAYEKDGINVEGLNVIIKNIESILDNYEVKAIEAEGKKLDPKLHEVVQEVEEDNLEEGTIVKEIAKGYIIRGKVLKYSKVCVSKKLIKK